MNIEELDKRLNAAILIKDNWLELYLEVYRYVTPDRDDRNLYGGYTRDAKNRTQLIYDSTAMFAAYQRANDLQGLIIPDSRPWGGFKVIQDTSKKAPIPDVAIDEFNNTVNDFIGESNLQVAAEGAFIDLTIGMGALWIDSPSQEVPLSFNAISSLACYPEFTNDQILSTGWTKWAMTGRQIIAQYPDYNGSQKEKLIKEPDIVYFLWIGEVKDKDKFFTYGVLDDDRMTFLYEEEKPYKRLIIFRDKVRPGEVQGRGVAIDLLPTIKELNTLTKTNLESMDYKANPPIFYDTNSKMNPYSFQQIAGTFIPRSPDQRNPMEAMQFPDHPSVLEEKRDLREMIKIGFKIDALGDVGAPVQSATEVSIRENKAQRTSATNIARLISELPKPLFRSCAMILDERQLLGSTIDLTDKRLRFDYTSPLLEIQRQNNLIALERATQFIQQSFGEQSTVAAYSLSILVPFIYKNFDLPAELFRSGGQLEQAIAQVGKAAAGQAPQPTTAATQPQAISAPQTLV